MKRLLPLLLGAMLMACSMFAPAIAEDQMPQAAEDITSQCGFESKYTQTKTSWLYDRRYATAWKSAKSREPSLIIKAPENQQIAGVYVCFGALPGTFELQVSQDGKTWTTAAQDHSGFLHCYLALPEPSSYVRMIKTDGAYGSLFINELYVLSEGTLPDWVQVWEPTHEKADILFISTHADDELIFFGGAIPTYAAERDCKVTVAYFAPSRPTRTSELLNGLWHMGVRHYPVLGEFPDTKAQNMEDAYLKAGGKWKVNEWFVQLYRQYRPEVVVTQDIEGEYGHTQHKIVSQAAIDAVTLAANAANNPKSADAYGTWTPKKLYLHLWPENQITFDWDVPLQSMNGATGMELADQAFVLYHITQANTGLGVRTTGMEYDNRVFGLVHTTVGEDAGAADFLENITIVP